MALAKLVRDTADCLRTTPLTELLQQDANEVEGRFRVLKDDVSIRPIHLLP
jgi:hypothetical protein